MKIAEAGSMLFCLAQLFNTTRKWGKAASLLKGHSDDHENLWYRVGSTNLLGCLASAGLVAAAGSWPRLFSMCFVDTMASRHERHKATSGNEREAREHNQKGYIYRALQKPKGQAPNSGSWVCRPKLGRTTIRSRETLELQL